MQNAQALSGSKGISCPGASCVCIAPDQQEKRMHCRVRKHSLSEVAAELMVMECGGRRPRPPCSCETLQMIQDLHVAVCSVHA